MKSNNIEVYQIYYHPEQKKSLMGGDFINFLNDDVTINFIRNKVPNSVSFVDEIAQVLGVNYDAAYRRITGKTTLGLNDVLKLMEAFSFSVDEVFTDKKDFIRVTKAEGVNSVDKLGDYFNIAISELKTISKFQKSQ